MKRTVYIHIYIYICAHTHTHTHAGALISRRTTSCAVASFAGRIFICTARHAPNLSVELRSTGCNISYITKNTLRVNYKTVLQPQHMHHREHGFSQSLSLTYSGTKVTVTMVTKV